MRTTLAAGVVVLALNAAMTGAEPNEEKVRYLRLSPEGPVVECSFAIKQMEKGWSIISVTERRDLSLEVIASYDEANRLVTATAIPSGKEAPKSTARVTVKGGKAQVARGKDQSQEFDVPAGVIVTSAPDWTDTFLLCRRYDRARGGKQEFVALWIHPEQPAQRLTFTVERQGRDSIEHAGQKVELDRLAIHIRNNSPYLGWADDKGRMIKLAGLPFKEGMSVELVREGYEKSAGKLKP